jgi:hypothetical protein
MTAPAEDPGANAVYLSFDEDDNDLLNVHTITVRLKVLTQAGVEHYSDVQVGVPERHFAIENVEAQTVHQDGTVIAFTGKPFLKTTRYHGEVFKATVFAMPDVQIGSILEYRYRLAYADNVLLPAHWYVQQDAFVEHAHFTFRPFSTTGSHYVVVDHGQTIPISSSPRPIFPRCPMKTPCRLSSPSAIACSFITRRSSTQTATGPGKASSSARI